MHDIYAKRLYIVDDSEFARAVIQSKLKKAGYNNLVLFESSVEAWDAVARSIVGEEDKIDLLITDLNMPGLDGMELISKLKEDPLSANIKIIVISADSDRVVIKMAKTLGAIAYLTKPVVTDELVAVVEAVLCDKPVPEVKGMFPVPDLSIDSID